MAEIDHKPTDHGDAKTQHAVARNVEEVWMDFVDVMEGRNGAVHFVASKTTHGVWYRIGEVVTDWGDERFVACSCPAGQAKPDIMCHHQRRLHGFLQAMNVARRRPSAPANTAAMVE